MQTLAHSPRSQHSYASSSRPRNTLLIGLAGWLFISFAAGGIGGLASIGAADFYEQLRLPEWAPSAGVFGPVWTFLYALMGISAWLVWKRSGANDAYIALTLFFVQLTLNTLWSWFFFDWHRAGIAFADIVLLWLVVAAMVVAFWHHSKAAALMQVPYLSWITFAAVLNYSVWQMNPQLLK